MEYEFWGIKNKDEPKNFIFAFGSIVNDESRKSTAPNAGYPIPVRISKEFGYRRMWNYQSSGAKLTALGLEKVDQNLAKSINGIIYSVNERDIYEFDKREEGYSKIRIPIKYIESYNWQCLPKQSNVWVYVPIGKKGEIGMDLCPSDKYYPILQTYIDITLSGFLKYGDDFAMEFLYTTGNWSKYWLNDRQIPRRPWLFQENYRKIDKFLEYIGKTYGYNGIDNKRKNYYMERKLPVEFSIYFISEKCDAKHSKHHKYYPQRNFSELNTDLKYPSYI